MILDQSHHRLFIVCRKPTKLVVLDTAWDTAGHSDGMAFDSAHKRIYVPGAEGYSRVPVEGS